jgi:hypothetical protein
MNVMRLVSSGKLTRSPDETLYRQVGFRQFTNWRFAMLKNTNDFDICQSLTVVFTTQLQGPIAAECVFFIPFNLVL